MYSSTCVVHVPGMYAYSKYSISVHKIHHISTFFLLLFVFFQALFRYSHHNLISTTTFIWRFSPTYVVQSIAFNPIIKSCTPSCCMASSSIGSCHHLSTCQRNDDDNDYLGKEFTSSSSPSTFTEAELEPSLNVAISTPAKDDVALLRFSKNDFRLFPWWFNGLI
jgi:hypothetical protein